MKQSNVRQDVFCTQCGASISRVVWNYGKNRPITAFFCDNKCKGVWQTAQREALGFDRAWLENEYFTLGKSANQIGREIGRNPKRIWEWIRDYGLDTRPRGTDYGQNFKPGMISTFAGKKHTAETKAKLRAKAIADNRRPWHPHVGPPMRGKKGAETPNWKGGITPERQSFYMSDKWKEAVKAVWKRDVGICQKCGTVHNNGHRGTFHIHHIVSFANRELRAEPSNLVLLCKPCHLWVHSKKNVNRDFLREA